MEESTLVDVRIPTREDGLWIEFADGSAGFVTWRDLGFESVVGRLILDSARLDTLGAAVEFDSANGQTVEIDALAIKSLIAGDAANRISTWIQRSDQAVARRIRAARLTSGMTQLELGAKAGMDQAVISKLERGLHRPRIDTLRRIAGALRIGIGDLLEAG